MSLNDQAKRVHAIHAKWWQDIKTGERIERNKGELLALVLSELSEALEGERRNLMDDKLPHRRMAEVEMADTVIRILDFAGGFGIELTDMMATETLPDNKGEFIFRISQTVANSMCGRNLIGPQHLSYALAMIEAYCLKFQYDLWGALEEKLAFNQVRADHKHEQRAKADGKQF